MRKFKQNACHTSTDTKLPKKSHFFHFRMLIISMRKHVWKGMRNAHWKHSKSKRMKASRQANQRKKYSFVKTNAVTVLFPVCGCRMLKNFSREFCKFVVEEEKIWNNKGESAVTTHKFIPHLSLSYFPACCLSEENF